MEPLVGIAQFRELLAGSGLEEWQLGVASAAIRSYCGWHVTPVVIETVTLDGDGGTILSLPTLRLVSLVEVRVQGEAVEDVEWSSDGSLRGKWPDRWRSIEVTMEHGYDQPADLLGVLVDAAARAVNSELGGAAETIGPFSFTASEGSTVMYAHELQILDRYRLPRLP
ncbi:hypothetical protein [Rhodococcus pyridinivorans]|uniref:Uncharacterized protein n=1 Tax=Rhodococcus pyridinivorans AK37 TaxID=1114960 RepID=H0JL54_9NOCA|nr:hypothetical protein [Rhodococcus pyridinivorans]EHK86389.1 hypothetical protein AK37_01537 [Rhodococcus pyridinivorans AK37]MCD2139521.1 hypothetical protein [Rhodococcus pyridinivorans]